MNVTISHHPVTQTVELSYDQATRDLFAQAAISADEFCRQKHSHVYFARQLSQFLDKFLLGTAVLHDLAELGSPPFLIAAAKMRYAWDVSTYAAVFRVEQGQPPAPWPSILLILSKAVTAPIRPVTLPPAVEIFDRSVVSREVWEGYELIRLWKYSSPPELPLYHMYELGLALHALPSPVPGIKPLMEDLTLGTTVFRFTMETLARAEVAG
jgi:hypothetical protein